MHKIKKKIPIYLLLAISLICSIIMLMGRMVAEGQNTKAACAMSYDDIIYLAKMNNERPLDWVAELKEAGLSYLVITDENEKEALQFASQAGLKYGRSGMAAYEGDAFLMPPMDRGELKAFDEIGGASNVPLILVEDLSRTGVLMPKETDLQKLEQPLVKGFYMYDNYCRLYQQSESPCEPENILFRAVFERGMRLVILTPLGEVGAVENKPAAYADIIHGLSKRIEARGFSFGSEFSTFNAPDLNSGLLAGALLLLPILLVLILNAVFQMGIRGEWITLSIASAMVVASAFLAPESAQKIGALIGMILFGILFAALLSDQSEGRGILAKIQSPYLKSVCLTLLALGIGAGGGLYISSLLGTERYMIGSAVFFGVKLSQLLPIGMVVLLLFFAFVKQKEYRLLLEDKKRLLSKALLLALAFGAVIAVLILRSGDTKLPIADFEAQVRNWMEMNLYVRPRTKEFLIAIPAMSLYIFACARRLPLLKLFFGSLSGIGCVSILNTFCHIVTPVQISLLRSVIGAGIGMILGLILLFILMLLASKLKREVS